jgi:hypothetical protein
MYGSPSTIMYCDRSTFLVRVGLILWRAIRENFELMHVPSLNVSSHKNNLVLLHIQWFSSRQRTCMSTPSLKVPGDQLRIHVNEGIF